ncbi:MAG: NAD(P)H-dependent oxidoreductase [Ilumatobacteraceae bacterium]|nr:NAD(P)H-dependent oxidoreductase [Ilumatobacteraceae bacterium]
MTSKTTDRIAVFAGSARRDSVNKHLARVVQRTLSERGRNAVFLDLADYEMPLYHGDLEDEHGVPEAAHRIAEQIAPTSGLLIASPEYNGAMTALLKNTVDWLSRVDYAILAGKYVGLMSATPGRTGGARGLGVVRHWFELMSVPVAEQILSVPHVHEVLDASGDVASFDDDSMQTINTFLDAYLRGYDKQRAANNQ